MRADFTLVTPPTVALLSTEEIREHLRVTHDAEDNYLDAIVSAATGWVEQYTGRALLSQVWRVTLDRWAERVWLARAAPVALAQGSPVVAVTYLNAAGQSTALAASAYVVNTTSEPASMTLAPGQAWPAIQARDEAVRIQYTCGHASAATVPAPLIHAAKLLCGHFYVNREAASTDLWREVPYAVEALCAPYRVFWREPVEG